MLPLVVGWNITLRVQAAPAAKEVEQLLVWEKSPLFDIPSMASAVLWLFVSVTACAGLVLPIATVPKLRLSGEKPTGARPTPVRLTAPVVFLTSWPSIVPTWFGAKVTSIVHDAPAAREVGQCDVIA